MRKYTVENRYPLCVDCYWQSTNEINKIPTCKHPSLQSLVTGDNKPLPCSMMRGLEPSGRELPYEKCGIMGQYFMQRKDI